MSEQDLSYTSAGHLHTAFIEPAFRAGVAALNLPRGGAVLDAGCGNGATFPMFYEYVGPAGRIAGIDCEQAHLDQARERAERHGLGGVVELHRGDLTQSLPFDAHAFDAVWAADIIMPVIFDAPVDITRRLAVTLKPGGTLAIHFSNWLRTIFLPGYSRLEHLILAAMERLFAGGGDWQGHIHPERALDWLHAAGLTDCRIELQQVVHQAPLAEEARRYLGGYMVGYYTDVIEMYGARVGMTDADKQLWANLSDPGSELYFLDQPNYYCAETAFQVFGRKP